MLDRRLLVTQGKVASLGYNCKPPGHRVYTQIPRHRSVDPNPFRRRRAGKSLKSRLTGVAATIRGGGALACYGLFRRQHREPAAPKNPLKGWEGPHGSGALLERASGETAEPSCAAHAEVQRETPMTVDTIDLPLVRQLLQEVPTCIPERHVVFDGWTLSPIRSPDERGYDHVGALGSARAGWLSASV